MKSGAEHNELIELAVKKLSGEASADELNQLKDLINEKVENQTLYEELEKIWISTEKAKGITGAEVDEEWLRLQKEMHRSDRKSIFPSLLKVAASIALIISVALVIIQLTKSDQLTLVASDKTITQQLSDGSVVTLKAGGELKYADGFADELREITLEGEAFFEVTPDKERPFVVHTQSIDVRVLGTSFNVKADESNTADVVVVDGLVSVKYQDEEVKLNPGERAIAVLTSKRLSKQMNGNPNFLSWKTMKFSFIDTPLQQVVNDLNNAFNSTIQIDESILNCPVTVSFQGQSLDSILRVLEATLSLTLKEESGKKVLSGPGC